MIRLIQVRIKAGFEEQCLMQDVSKRCRGPGEVELLSLSVILRGTPTNFDSLYCFHLETAIYYDKTRCLF